MTHLDGNVLAGPLSELGDLDVTTLVGTCSGCHDASVMAAAMVYPDAPGLVVRCHVCGDVLLVIVQSTAGTEIFVRGVTGLPLFA